MFSKVVLQSTIKNSGEEDQVLASLHMNLCMSPYGTYAVLFEIESGSDSMIIQ